MIFGHFAVSALLHHYLDADLESVVAGGIFPDAVDKTLCQVLRVTPSGRMYAHTLLSVAFSTAVVSLLWGRQKARAWALGYLGHLAADGGGRLPLLYPFKKYEFVGGEPGLFQIIQNALHRKVDMGIELILVVWAACVLGSQWPERARDA
jgi:hypothetical protein